MKLRLAFASMMVLSTVACANGPADQALTALRFLENNPGEGISYTSKSGSGGDVTLRNVTIRGNMPAPSVAVELKEGETPPPPVAVPPAKSVPIAMAETVTFKGLTMKEGKPFFTDITVNGIAPADMGPGPKVKLGSVTLAGMNEATAAFIASTFTKEGPGAVPTFEQWGFSKASLNGLTVAGDIPQEEGTAGTISVELGEISVSNLKDQMIGLTRLAGLKGAFNVPGMPAVDGTFDLGTFDVHNFRGAMFADAFEAGMASMGPDAKPVDWSKVFAGYTSPLEGGIDKATWTGANVNVSGIKGEVTPYSYTATRNAAGVVTAVSTPRYSMKLTADSSGGTLGAMGLMVLAMTGYPSNVVEMYFSGDASFDPEKDVTRWNGYNVGITDMLDVKIDAGLIGLQQAMPTLLTGLMGVVEAMEGVVEEGLDEEDSDDSEKDDSDAQDDNPLGGMPPEAQAAAATMVMGLISLQMTDLDISITDKQLIEFLVSTAAMQSGQSAAAFRQDLVSMVQGSATFMTDAGIDPVLANEATAAISAFLAGPGTLRIQMKPKTPIGAMTMMMAPPTKESLGFSATFTPAAPPQQ